MDKLSDGLRGRIASFLTLGELERCSVTCRAWRRSMVAPLLSGVTVEASWFRSRSASGALLGWIQPCTARLTKLTLTDCGGCDEVELARCLEMAFHLRELLLFDLEVAKDETLGVLLNGKLGLKRNLNVLWMSGTILCSESLLCDLFRGLSKLQDIRLGGCAELTETTVQVIHDACKGLESLEIFDCHKLEAFPIRCDKPAFQRLKLHGNSHLEVLLDVAIDDEQGVGDGTDDDQNDQYGIHGEGHCLLNPDSESSGAISETGQPCTLSQAFSAELSVPKAASEARWIQYLHISFCQITTLDCLREPHFENLVELRLPFNGQLRVLSVFSKPVLRVIDVRHCALLEDLTLVDIPELRLVEMTGCSKMTDCVITRCSELKTLDFSMLCAMRHIDLNYLQQLEHVQLSGCSSDLNAVAADCPKLGDFFEPLQYNPVLAETESPTITEASTDATGQAEDSDLDLVEKLNSRFTLLQF